MDAEAFRARVDEIIGEVDGELSVVVAMDGGFVLYERDAGLVMESASLYKLGIMVELYRLRESELLSFDDMLLLLPDYFGEDDGVYGYEWVGSAATVGSLLYNMVALSSNVAAHALLARVGNEAVNDTMRELGMYDTEIRWNAGAWVPVGHLPVERAPGRSLLSFNERATEAEGHPTVVVDEPLSERAAMASNVTSAADIARLLLLLLSGQVVSDDASAEMLDLMTQQAVRDRIPRYLPEDALVANKTGNWEGLVHDAGVIWGVSGPVVIVVLSDIGDEGRAVEIISTIALEAYWFEP